MNLKRLALTVLSALAFVGCSSGPPSGWEEEPAENLSQALPSGFTKTRIASGLSLPTGMAFASDGRIFVLERGTTAGGTGRVRIVKNGSLLSTPFVSITVNNASVSANERGLLGIALDPNFASNHFVYVYYTVNASTAYNRISRFTANGDVAVSGSETLILKLDNLSAGNHNGGGLAFGKDGKLYVGVGENHNAANAIDLSNHLGKVLRLNPDGSAPSDNPFYNSSDGITARDRIWTYGHRNPWRVAVQPGTGRIFVDDVGESTWEEINDLVKGKDYGWRGGTTDGDSTVWYKYDHNTGKCITGGTFYNPPVAPGGFSSYVGKYFFTDYTGGWIKAIDTSTKSVSTFDTGINGPTDLQVGTDGNLYYAAYGSGEVWRISSTTAQQSLILSDAAVSVNEGSTKTFSVKLALQPSANVTVNVAKTSGDASVSVSPSSLTFTTSNWSTPQNVTVTAAEDTDNVNGSASVSVSSSGLATQTVSVTAIDNDVTGPIVSISAPMNGATVSGTNAEFYGGSNLDGSTTKGEFYIDNVLSYTDVGPGHYHYNGSHASWDTTVLGEGTHTLKLTVYDASNRTGSDQVQVTVDNLPSPWDHQDIGAVGAKGGARASAGTFTVNGSGADIWGTADEFQFVNQQLTGDGTIVARVASVTNTATWSKFGVMMRDGTAAGAANVFAGVTPTAANGFRKQIRATAGGTSTSCGTRSTDLCPGTSALSATSGYVKIARTGNTFVSSFSTNGTTWTQLGSDTITMASTIRVGLAVTSHLDGTLATGTFDNVSITSGGGCTPTTCSALGKNCGSVDNGCGGTLNCGTCTAPQTCGGGGTPNVCGGSSCTPESDATFCSRLGKNCGSVTGTDNCGTSRTVSSCGTCTSPQTCGGGGTSNVCGGGASPWSSQDVGAVAAAGSFSQSGATYTVAGSGADIYGTADEFRFVYQNLTGDGTIVARVVSVTNTATWSKAGVMMRDGTATGAANVFAGVTPTAANGFRKQIRATAGGSSSSCGTRSVDLCPGVSALDATSGYVKIVRTGNTFVSSFSTNGTTWTQMGSDTITMASTIQVGLAVTSHLDGTLATATFDNVSLTSGGGCTPTTCSALGKNCGSVNDGCGGTLNCGTCTSPNTCGGGGTPNVCGTSSCTPTTCAAQGKNCGSINDGCGGTLNCGTCTSPNTCGGGGTANVCAPKVSNLTVYDTGSTTSGTAPAGFTLPYTNASYWALLGNFQTASSSSGTDFCDWMGGQAFVQSVDSGVSNLLGKAWIRTATESKKWNGTSPAAEGKITLATTANVYLIIDDRAVANSAVETGWTDTTYNFTIKESDTGAIRVFSVFQKTNQIGDVYLPIQNYSSAFNYFVIVD
jgi:glucose/arabinose dehydrogenase